MKKTIALLCAMLMLFGLLAGCGSGAASKEDKSFVVGFDCEFPPYGYIDDNGDYDGFDLALAKEACERLGWEFSCVAIDWDSKDSELSAGNIDCIWNGFTINGREDDYTWSVPYVDNSQVIVVKADSGIETLADLAGKTVITQAASSALTALEDNAELSGSFGNLLETADYNSAFLELEMGTADAVAVDQGVAYYQLAEKGDGYVVLAEAVASEQYGVGFLKGNTEQCDAVNGALKEMAEDGTMMEIAQNYVDMGLVTESLCLCY